MAEPIQTNNNLKSRVDKHSHHDCDEKLTPNGIEGRDLNKLKTPKDMGPRKWGTKQAEALRLERAKDSKLDYVRKATHGKALLAMGHSGQDVKTWQKTLQDALDNDQEFRQIALDSKIISKLDENIVDKKANALFGDQTRRLTELAQLRYGIQEGGAGTGQVGKKTLEGVEAAVAILKDKHHCVEDTLEPGKPPAGITVVTPENPVKPPTVVTPVNPVEPAGPDEPVGAPKNGKEFWKNFRKGMASNKEHIPTAIKAGVGLAAVAGLAKGATLLAGAGAIGAKVAVGGAAVLGGLPVVLGAAAVAGVVYTGAKLVGAFNRKNEDAVGVSDYNKAAYDMGDASLELGLSALAGSAVLRLTKAASTVKGWFGRGNNQAAGPNPNPPPGGTPNLGAANANRAGRNQNAGGRNQNQGARKSWKKPERRWPESKPGWRKSRRSRVSDQGSRFFNCA